jgi:peptidase C25-like protein/flagellar hook capping protein FlgD/interleukin-like EMT inducer protein
MRKIFGSILSILLISIANANASYIKVVENEVGIVVSLSNIQYEATETEDGVFWKMTNADPSLVNSNLDKKFDEIQVVFAYPQDSEILWDMGDIGYHNSMLKYSKENSGNITINKIGYSRGIPIAMLTIRPDMIEEDLNYIESAKITIKYPVKISLSQAEIPNLQKAFYSRITNNAMLGKLYHEYVSPKKAKQNKMLADDEWFKPEQEWLKITTKNDGIASVPAAEIISANQAFDKVDIGKIALIHKGEEYPVYVENDNNGVFDSGDILMFEGRHADGDTTWFDFYTDEEAYYLTTIKSQALQLSRETLPVSYDEDLNYLPVFYHYEKDTIHSSGVILYNIFTEHILGQGWKWAEMSSNKFSSETFIHNFPVFSNSPTKKIKLRAYMSSLNFNLNSKYEKNKHNYSVHLNKVEIINDSFDHATNLILETEIENNVLNSLNRIEIKSIPNYDKGDVIEPEKINLDWYEIEANMLPRAMDGKFSFEYQTKDKRLRVKIPGFRSKDIYGINRENNEIFKTEYEEGTEVNLAVISGEQPTLSIMLNDKSEIHQANAVMIAFLDKDNIVRVKRINASGSNINEYTQDIPTGNLVVVVSNSSEDPSSQLIDFAQKAGADKISQFKSGDSYAFVGKYNSKQKVFEELGDLVEHNEFIPTFNTNYYQAILTLEKNNIFDITLMDKATFETPSLYSVKNTVLKNPELKADYIVVYHPDFETGAKELAEYRSQHENVVSMAVDVFDIYKEFNYGKKSIHAIKDFFRYTYENWQKPAPLYVVLVGDASWDARGVQPTTKNKDFIPSHGWPVSDYWYTLLDEKDDYWQVILDPSFKPDDEVEHDIILGRIPVKNNDEFNAIFNKIKEYDTAPTLPWMKKFLLLSGGLDDNERGVFAYYSNVFNEYIILPDLCADTTHIHKRDPQITGTLEATEIISAINEGATWVNFLGHASAQKYDMDGWQADRLSNKGKYSVFSTISCNTGAFASPTIMSRAEEYLLEPDKGAIVSLSSTFVGILSTERKLFRETLVGLSLPDQEIRYLGAVAFYGKSKLYMNSSEIITAMQYAYLGDPLTKFNIFYKPDLYLYAKDATVLNPLGSELIKDKDSIMTFSGYIYNNGLYTDQVFDVKLIHQYEGGEEIFTKTINGICYNEFVQFDIVIIDKPGRHKLILKIDDEGVIDEETTENNNYSVTVEVFKESLLAVEPLDFWNMNLSNLQYRVINPIKDEYDSFEYDFRIYSGDDFDQTPVYSSAESEITEAENYIDWKPKVALESNKSYWFAARASFGDDHKSTEWLSVPFNTSSNVSTIENAQWKQSSREQFEENIFEDTEVIDLDTDKSAIRLDPKEVNIYVNSGFGDHKADPVIPNDATVRVGNITYLDYIIDDLVGLYVIELNGDDASFISLNYFDTFKNQDKALAFVNYLRNSVDKENIMIATIAGPGFNAFGDIQTEDPTSIASMDSLRALFAEYGGVKCDTLKNWRHSYCILGKRGWKPGEAFEALDTTQNLAEFNALMTFAVDSGLVSLPTIGPAKAWKKLTIGGDLPLNTVELKTTILGSGDDVNSKLLIETSDSEIDLSKIDPKLYTYLEITTEMTRLTEDYSFYINEFTVDYQPDAEIAAVKSQTFAIEESVLRGDSISLQFTYENISLRASADDFISEVRIEETSGTPVIHHYEIDKLGANEQTTMINRYPTLSKTGANVVTLNPNILKDVKELYYFNNESDFDIDIYEDSDVPWIKVFMDGVEVQDGDFVSITPDVRIEVYDNSRLPINAEDIITRMNTTWPCDIPGKCNYESFGNEIELKGVITFTADSLDLGNNNIIEIKYQDGTGNQQTFYRSVYVAKIGNLADIKVFPNPFGSSGTNIEFDYKAPDYGGTAQVLIYNTTGRLVRQLEHSSNLGTNVVHWDGKDAAGNSVATGMYYFTIQINESFVVDPVFGKAVHIRD